MSEPFDVMTERNKRVQARYDELMREGKHGHYETLFRVVREELDRLRAETVRLQAINDQLVLQVAAMRGSIQYVNDPETEPYEPPPYDWGKDKIPE